MNIKNSLALCFALFLGSLPTANAQVAENSKLFREIMEMDSQIFDQGFNQCKLEMFQKNIDENLEFFHDKGGTQNKAQFMKAVKENICSNPNGKPIRTLVAGSSKVFALENNGVLYGAVQQGVHEFRTKGADIAVEGYTTAKFTHVWLLRNGQWKLKTSISFDHQHKDGKLANTHTPDKKQAQAIRLFELTIASLTFGIYSRE